MSIGPRPARHVRPDCRVRKCAPPRWFARVVERCWKGMSYAAHPVINTIIRVSVVAVDECRRVGVRRVAWRGGGAGGGPTPRGRGAGVALNKKQVFGCGAGRWRGWGIT